MVNSCSSFMRMPYLEQVSDKDDEYSNKDIYHIGLSWVCYRSELIQDSLQNSVKLDNKTDIIYQIGVGSYKYQIALYIAEHQID